MKCKCGGSTSVVNTKQNVDYVRRQRKCSLCKQQFYTAEQFMGFLKEVYTETEAATIKRRQVETRRLNEDTQDANKRSIY